MKKIYRCPESRIVDIVNTGTLLSGSGPMLEWEGGVSATGIDGILGD